MAQQFLKVSIILQQLNMPYPQKTWLLKILTKIINYLIYNKLSFLF